MRRYEAVLRLQQGVIAANGLHGHDVEPRGVDLAGVERVGEGLLVYERAAGVVYYNDAVLHHRDVLAADEIRGRRREGAVEADYVRAAQQLAELDVFGYLAALGRGTAAGGEDPLQPLVLLVKDISVALFSVTDITNIAYPDPSPVANTSDRIRLRDRIADASGKYDFVIVMLHYGDEYTTEPRTSDRALVGSLIEAGADVVFGNHAHVIRAFERFDSPKGGDAFVFWGLGNFIGWMGHRPECSVGGIFRVVLRVTEKADGLRLLSVNDPSVELTYSVNRGREHRTLFLRDAAPFSDDAPRLFETVSALLKSRDSRITVF